MIIKKPYAFIIKHFRLIHLLLLAPMIYLIFGTFDIAHFLNNYVRSGFTYIADVESLVRTYANIFMYISCLIVSLVYIVLTVILQRKDKPTRFYGFTIIFYFILFIYFILVRGTLNNIENRVINITIINLFRDISFILAYLEYIFIIFTFIRGIGFDIQKFNFQSDLKNLEISSDDNEEIEFLINSESYKRKRNLRRYFRELGYYYKENKFIFRIIFVVLILGVGWLIFFREDNEIHNQVTNMNQSFKVGNLSVKVEEAYLTHMSSGGEELNSDKDYIVLNLNIINDMVEDAEFNYRNFQIKNNNKYYSPTLNLASNFLDYGYAYNGSYIKGNTDYDYILAYEIDRTRRNNDFELVLYSSYSSANNKIILREIPLSLQEVSSSILVNNYSLNDVISLENTTFKNTTLSFKSYEFSNNFRYEYEFCPKVGQCYTSTNSVSINYQIEMDKYTFLIIDYDLVFDEDSLFKKNNGDYISFFENFLTIRYFYNENVVASKAIVYNPNNYSKKLILKVNKQVSNADSIEALIRVRNRTYVIKLK